MDKQKLIELRQDLSDALSLAAELGEYLRYMAIQAETQPDKAAERIKHRVEGAKDLYGAIATIILKYVPVGVTDATSS